MLHTAYGRIGTVDVGGTEIISYDAASQQYRKYLALTAPYRHG